MSIEAKLNELNLILEEPAPSNALFIPVSQSGNLLYTSGQVCRSNGKLLYAGKLGGSVTIEDGQKAAQQCILNCLSALQAHLGSLDKVKKIVKVVGFVQSDPDFADQPLVVNAASQLLLDLFGEKGQHARSAIGVNALPGNTAVEIEMIVEI